MSKVTEVVNDRAEVGAQTGWLRAPQPFLLLTKWAMESGLLGNFAPSLFFFYSYWEDWLSMFLLLTVCSMCCSSPQDTHCVPPVCSETLGWVHFDSWFQFCSFFTRIHLFCCALCVCVCLRVCTCSRHPSEDNQVICSKSLLQIISTLCNNQNNRLIYITLIKVVS